MKRRKAFRHQCSGKIQHASRDVALIVARKMTKKKDTPMTVYRCSFCGHWHTGHTPNNIRTAIEESKDRRARNKVRGATPWASFANVILTGRA